jgi:dTDP-4-dehydrorhamnose reductase
MKIGICGCKGNLGSELVNYWNCIPMVCDVRFEDSIRQSYEEVKPDVVINCAAETAVDACEDYDIDEHGVGRHAVEVNFWGVEYVKKVCKCPVIHISTDYVFNGKHGAYAENTKYDDPVNVYGWTKWLGEIAFLTPRENNGIVVRTTGLFGRIDTVDFVSKVTSTVSKGEQLKVAKDLEGNQTYIPFLAEGLMYVISHFDKFMDTPILHVASKEVISRYEFALMICSVFNHDKNLVIPVSSSELEGWVAKRPVKGGLQTKLARKMGVPIHTILEGLQELKGEL